MNNLLFDKDQFTETINNIVPKYQQNTLLKLLEENEEYDYTTTIKQLIGESTPENGIRYTSTKNNNSEKSIYSEIKKETYDFLCTKSAKYRKVRNKSTVTIEQIVLIIAVSIAENFHIAVELVTGAVSLFLMVALKISVNSWCNLNTPL